MALFKTLAGVVLRRLASDPRVQEKVKRTIKKEVIPRSIQTWQQLKPGLVKIAKRGNKFFGDKKS